MRPPGASSATVLTFAFLALAAPGVARAQDDPGIDANTDLQDFLPMGGPRDFLTVPSPMVSPHRSVGFGLIVNYMREPLVLEAGTPAAEYDAVDHQITADFLWAFGLWDHLQVGLALPVIVSQSGDGIAPLACDDPENCDTPELAATAIRDIRLDAKLRFGKTGIGQTMALAVSVTLPTGDSENFAANDGFAVTPMFMFGALRPTSRLRLGGAIGGRIRAETRLGDHVFGPELWGRVGIGYEVLSRFAVSVEYFGNIAIADFADDRQELIGALRYSPDRAEDVTLEIGAGGALSDSPGSASLRAIAGVTYAPLGRDTDGDGVLDRSDACLTEREDRDGFEDADGCPDPDNDGDGVLDAQDACDDEAEDADGFGDEDGCPDRDNDDDGVLDGDDQCPEAEDRDEFEDEDGCPDPDNDGDGVLDVSDTCPIEAEDVDGFEDDNGCPDPDNDHDGILDAQDGCPNDAEDRDGHDDADGCGDPDDDFDGVPDATDRCNGEPETINGRNDDDGCPDPGAESFLFRGDVLVAKRGPRFARGSSALPPRSEALVAQLVLRVRSRVGARVVVSGFGDRAVDDATQQALARGRAESLQAALVAGGIPAARIQVVVGPLAARRTGPQFEIRAEPAASPSPAAVAPGAARAAPAPAPAAGGTSP